MYILEKLIKLYINLKKNNRPSIVIKEDNDEVLEDIVTCKHNFMPIDSTGNILACSKCGYVVKKEKLKNRKHSNKDFS